MGINGTLTWTTNVERTLKTDNACVKKNNSKEITIVTLQSHTEGKTKKTTVSEKAMKCLYFSIYSPKRSTAFEISLVRLDITS